MAAPRMRLTETAPAPHQALLSADRAIREGPLDETVRELVKIRASQLNGCAFCVDKHAVEARKLGESEHRIYQLSSWRESRLFSDAERAALAYTDQATRLGDEGVTDEVWESVSSLFEPEELGYLVAQVALINALNRIAVPLRFRPPVRSA
jgi:AhpD family alkylhydroperoxidase